MTALPFVPCIVTGAPRSGTTLLYALICTSTDVNPLAPDHVYLGAIGGAIALGHERFATHTQAFFDSRRAFDDDNRNLLVQLLTDAWRRFGQPRILAVKDPALIKAIGSMSGLLPEAKFAVSIRNPLDVVASRVAVLERRDGAKRPSLEQIKYFAGQYADYYRSFLTCRSALQGRLLCVRYERLVGAVELSPIESFLGTRLDLASLWKRSLGPIEGFTDPEWLTPLHGLQPSTRSVDRYASILREDEIAVVRTETADVESQLDALAGR